MALDINILPADTFKVISKGVPNSHDQKIITMLYQPIIGAVATNLYFTLINYLNKKEENHYHLMVSTRINLESILEAKRKLEGIGLIKTYLLNDNDMKHIVYEIYNPLSAYDFIESPLLSTLLMHNVGKRDYEQIINNFKIEKFDLSSYKDVTASFSEVFKLENIDVCNNLEISLEKNNKNEIKIDSKIDINGLLELIPSDLLNKKSITKDTINLINNMAYVYNLDLDKMKDIIFNSVDVTTHRIDKELFRRNARNYYEFNNSGKVTNIVYQKQPDALKNKNLDVSNKAKLIYSFENVSPRDFLRSKSDSGKVTQTDLKIIEYLLGDLKMKPGVVNVLVDYVLKTNNNKLTKAYVDFVASQWIKNHIERVDEAIELAKKEFKKHNEAVKKKNKIETPKWMDKKIESSIATKEEQEEMSKMLKELVGEK